MAEQRHCSFSEIQAWLPTTPETKLTKTLATYLLLQKCQLRLFSETKHVLLQNHPGSSSPVITIHDTATCKNSPTSRCLCVVRSAHLKGIFWMKPRSCAKRRSFRNRRNPKRRKRKLTAASGNVRADSRREFVLLLSVLFARNSVPRHTPLWS